MVIEFLKFGRDAVLGISVLIIGGVLIGIVFAVEKISQYIAPA